MGEAKNREITTIKSTNLMNIEPLTQSHQATIYKVKLHFWIRGYDFLSAFYISQCERLKLCFRNHQPPQELNDCWNPSRFLQQVGNFRKDDFR